MFLIFTLLNLKSVNGAQTPLEKPKLSFTEVMNKIYTKDLCEVGYNPSRTAAIVNPDCGSAIYVDFKHKSIYPIIDHWPNVFSPIWLNDKVVHIKGPCGTGCAQSIIFIAPATTISCATHEYRITQLSPNEPPDYYNNTPLLIDPQKEIYVCYDETDHIQVFPFPKHRSIRPPEGYFSEKAEIHHHHLIVTYEDKQGHRKHITYGRL